MKIVILSQQGDPHTNAIVSAVHSLSTDYDVIVFERYRNDHFINISSANDYSPVLSVGNQTIHLSDPSISGIYWRVKPYYPGEIPAGGGSRSEIFCANEWKHALHSLYYLNPDHNWINKLDASARLNYKPYQLQLARQVGLLTPESLISNHQTSILPFYDALQNVIYKPINSASTPTKPIFTSKISRQDLLDSKNSLAMAPGIFQENIVKHHELRVTVVGESVFVAKINSQKNKNGKVDWRKAVFDEGVFEKGVLSSGTTEKLLAFHRQSQLCYGAYDFIVDENGREIFLECNPSGQWLWIEELVDEYQVSLAMAKLLMNDSKFGNSTNGCEPLSNVI